MRENKSHLFGDRQLKILREAREQEKNPTKGSKVNSAKHRMRRDACTSQNIHELLQTFKKDLDRIEEYYHYVREYPGGVHEFEEQVLPPLEIEITRLIQTLEEWKSKIPDEAGNRVEYAREVESVYREPLYKDLSHFPPQFDGDGEMLANLHQPEAREDRQEARTREKCLMAMFCDRDLYEMLEYMATEPKNKKLPDRTKGGQVWKYWVGRFHKRRYGLVEEDNDGWRPKLTDRGEAVFAAASSLLESNIVGREAERSDKNRHEVVLLLLSRYCDLPQPDSIPGV